MDITIYDTADNGYDLRYNKRYIRQAICEAIHKLNEGRNSECFPLIGFGGKDADLDAFGCTGIEEVGVIDEEGFDIKIAGHKTVCPTDIENVDEIVQELVCGSGYPGEWTGDDWSLYCEEWVRIPWLVSQNGKRKYRDSARLAVETAEVVLFNYGVEMRYIEEAVDRELERQGLDYGTE